MNRQEYLEEQDHYSWYIIAIVTLSVKAVTIIFLAIILAADSVLPKTTIGEGQKKCNVMIIVTFCLMYLATALPIVSKDWAAKKVTIFNSIICLVNISENVLFFTCILPQYVADEITNEV